MCLRPSGCSAFTGRAVAARSQAAGGSRAHRPASAPAAPPPPRLRPTAPRPPLQARLRLPLHRFGRSFTSSPLGARPFRLAPISVCLPHAREGGASEGPPPKHPEGASTPTFPTPNRAVHPGTSLPHRQRASTHCLSHPEVHRPSPFFAREACIRSCHPGPVWAGGESTRRGRRPTSHKAGFAGREGAGFFPLHPYTRIRARRAKQIADAPSEVCVRAHERGRQKDLRRPCGLWG